MTLFPSLAELDDSAGVDLIGVVAVVRDGLAWLGFADSVTAFRAFITIIIAMNGALMFAANCCIAYLEGQTLRDLRDQLFGRYSLMGDCYLSRTTSRSRFSCGGR